MKNKNIQPLQGVGKPTLQSFALVHLLLPKLYEGNENCLILVL